MTYRDVFSAVLLTVLFLVPVFCSGLGNKQTEPEETKLPALESLFLSKEVHVREEEKEEELIVQVWYGKESVPELHLARTIDRVLVSLPHIKSRAHYTHLLLLETARVESWLGLFALENRCAGGLGIFQIHESTARDLIRRLPEDARLSLMMHFRKDWSLEKNLENNVPFGIAAAASYYWLRGMDKRDLSTVKKRGEFWKEKYNTKAGAGTLKEYIRRNEQ